jgi:hypothetical protein
LATTLAVLDARTKRPGSGGRRGSARASRRVRCGSYFHQFKPICSALSTEQTRSRIRMVSSSTFASAIRTSPAITNPLSSTRSRISIRLVVPETVGLSMRVFLMARGRILGLPVLCQNDDAIGSSRKMSIPRPRHSVTDACKVGGRGGGRVSEPEYFFRIKFSTRRRSFCDLLRFDARPAFPCFQPFTSRPRPSLFVWR